jgi:hypothetical protein
VPGTQCVERVHSVICQQIVFWVIVIMLFKNVSWCLFSSANSRDAQRRPSPRRYRSFSTKHQGMGEHNIRASGKLFSGSRKYWFHASMGSSTFRERRTLPNMIVRRPKHQRRRCTLKNMNQSISFQTQNCVSDNCITSLITPLWCRRTAESTRRIRSAYFDTQTSSCSSVSGASWWTRFGTALRWKPTRIQ